MIVHVRPVSSLLTRSRDVSSVSRTRMEGFGPLAGGARGLHGCFAVPGLLDGSDVFITMRLLLYAECHS
jgi:hypothetical protein